MREWLTELGGFAPNLFGMLLILVLGFIVSRFAERLVSMLLKRVGFDRVSQDVGIGLALSRARLEISAAEIVGKLVFWLLMLTFLVSAAEALGLENVSRTIDSFVGYLPNVIAAVVIVVIGVLLANFARELVASGATNLGVGYANVISRLVFGVILVVVGTLAIGQLHIETMLINRIVEIALIATSAALALAIGLGSRDTARNIIAGVYAREAFRPGTDIDCGKDRGKIEEVGAINTRIRVDSGEGGVKAVYVPNGQLTEMMVRSYSEHGGEQDH